MSTDAWALIHAEREALAEDLDGLTAEQWATGSLCSQWSVHQVLGHIVATAKMSPAKFFAQFAAARFNFTAFNAKNVIRDTRSTPAATMAEFR
ncbi:MAG TPA: maleylpyruvate isomerase family mycothiol-dependent enzyme, partial [Nakamurella sp.]